MPIFHFHISKGKFSNSPGREVELPDQRAVWNEATGLCVDVGRDIVSDFDRTPEWSLEVTDAEGKPIFRFRFLAETLV
jgi:hypothetical protein